MNRVQPNTQLPIQPAIRIYAAKLTQVGTGAPTATIAQNNIGEIIWTRDSTGSYKGTLADAFIGTTTVQITSGRSTAFYEGAATNTQTITILTFNAGGSLGDDLLYDSTIEIKVYNPTQGTIIPSTPIPQIYNVYSALLTQTGTNNPVATILNNTIGTITWVRNATGAYEGNYTPGFPLEKTTLTINTAYNNMMFYLANFETGEPSTQVLLKTYETAGDPLSINDGLLYYAFIEIRIYN